MQTKQNRDFAEAARETYIRVELNDSPYDLWTERRLFEVSQGLA
jgi:hypothetical protein